jgi:hypothetical protein
MVLLFVPIRGSVCGLAVCLAVGVLFAQGRPWMKGCIENHPLFLSVVASAVGVAACAWEVSPYINNLIHLEAFPNDEFR